VEGLRSESFKSSTVQPVTTEWMIERPYSTLRVTARRKSICVPEPPFAMASFDSRLGRKRRNIASTPSQCFH
jgi:hypothetical protein